MCIWKLVETRIFYGVIVLFFISTTTVFAQGPLLSVQTDDNLYDEGDTIVISGIVNTVFADNTPIIIQIINEDAFVYLAQKDVAKDGTFSETVIAEGKLWHKSGEYIVRASYHDQTVETTFIYNPKSEIVETTTNFEVDAGSYGTFDVKYTIRGGTVENMVIDCDDEKTCGYAIIVQIDATDEGTITLELPREFIGAEKQNGKDDTFIILIDGIEVSYQESLVHQNSRVITINFEEEDSDIEIIGTYVVPEFGTIVMIILIVGIMTVIFASRNKLQIKI